MRSSSETGNVSSEYDQERTIWVAPHLGSFIKYFLVFDPCCWNPFGPLVPSREPLWEIPRGPKTRDLRQVDHTSSPWLMSPCHPPSSTRQRDALAPATPGLASLLERTMCGPLCTVRIIVRCWKMSDTVKFRVPKKSNMFRTSKRRHQSIGAPSLVWVSSPIAAIAFTSTVWNWLSHRLSNPTRN